MEATGAASFNPALPVFAGIWVTPIHWSPGPLLSRTLVGVCRSAYRALCSMSPAFSLPLGLLRPQCSLPHTLTPALHMCTLRVPQDSARAMGHVCSRIFRRMRT